MPLRHSENILPIAAGDLDGDGDLDLAGAVGGRVSIFVNRPVSMEPDCNANGIPDICEVDCNGRGLPNDCALKLGIAADCDGDGVPDSCEADCNHDGIPDDCEIASQHGFDCNANGIPDSCELDRNDCDENGVPDDCDLHDVSQDCNRNGALDACDLKPHFAMPVMGYNVLSEPLERVGIGDLNLDGHLDIVALTYAGFVVFGNDGKGLFRSKGEYSTADRSTTAIDATLQDLDNDGDLDVAVIANEAHFGGKRGLVSIFMNTGHASFSRRSSRRVDSEVLGVRGADLSGDGRPDLALGAKDGLWVLQGNADGTFAVPVRVAENGGSVAIGDFDGD